MSERALATGKLPASLLEELLADAPTLPPEVLLGPRLGEDGCAISLPAGVLIAATDPITMTGSDVGGHAVAINANDVAVMGVRPRWFLAAVLLPVGTREAQVRALFAQMRTALREHDVALVGGHTEVTAAVVQPVVVGQMLGFAEDGRFVRTGGMRPGDCVLQIGPAPIEAAAVLAAEAGGRLADVPAATLARAVNATREPGISVVEAALRCAVLGATALHDPTEGGLANGLHELACAAKLPIAIDREAVLWFEPGVAVCRASGANPWGALASGALLAAFPQDRVDSAIDALQRDGHHAAVIGKAGGVDEPPGVAFADGEALPNFERDEVARVLAEL